MAKSNKSKTDEDFMIKFAKFIVDKRNLFFLIFILLAIFSAFSKNWVNVENELSAYLPDKSETRIGLSVMDDEFVTYGTARLMISSISYEDANNILNKLKDIDGVQSIAFDETTDHYVHSSALYDITFDYDEKDDRCLKALDDVKSTVASNDIYVSTSLGDTVSETIADEMQVIIIYVAVIVLTVLILTSQTYAEIPVLLITFIAAAILNTGSNFVLGTISFVSDSVTIVLQLALSIDYAIIFCNRYKEEHERLPVREAVIISLSKAIPEICGSSLTTIGGLAAMLFMQFKIGADMGICLIKAIIFSLIAVFFLMPGLLMLFGNLMDKTKHKNFVPKIPFVGKFDFKTRYLVPPIFLVLIIAGFMVSQKCPYVYGYSSIKTPKLNATQIADNMINDNFGKSNMLALLVPAGSYKNEASILDELEAREEVDYTMGLSNIQALGDYVLTDRLTPRQFSELTDLDYKIVELLYATYAVNDENYGKVISGISTYKVPLIDMFMFLYEEVQDGYVTLDSDLQKKLDDAYVQMNSAKQQLQGENYSRMLVYLTLPESGDETYSFIDEIRSIAQEYYSDGEVYVVGNSTMEYDFEKSFATDNLVVSIISILIVLIVLLGTFKSVGMPILLIAVIQGSIWINFAFPAMTHSVLFFMSYLVVSSIQMGANIDYAIVISGRFMELKNQIPHEQAVIETMNFAFPTIITSGTILAVAGTLIGKMTSEATIAGIGQSLGRGTILSIVIVMFALPQILLLGEKIIDKTSFSVRHPINKKIGSGLVRVDGMVRGEVHGTINGVIHAFVDGDVNLSVLAGTALEEGKNEDEENKQNS